MDSFAFFFSPDSGPNLASARSGGGGRGSTRASGGTNVVMKIYGPNCVALVEFFLPRLERERERLFGLDLGR